MYCIYIYIYISHSNNDNGNNENTFRHNNDTDDKGHLLMTTVSCCAAPCERKLLFEKRSNTKTRN